MPVAYWKTYEREEGGGVCVCVCKNRMALMAYASIITIEPKTLFQYNIAYLRT